MKEKSKPLQLELKSTLSPRIKSLYGYITSQKSGICIERAYYLTETYKNSRNLPNIILRAKAVANVLQNMTIFLIPGSLLAGNQASKPCYAPLFPEFDVDFMKDEIIEGKPYFPWERPSDKYVFDSKQRSKLNDVLSWWKGQTHTDRLMKRLPKEALITHLKIKAVDIGAYFQGGDGHYSPGHRWLFDHGLQYILDECDKYLNNLDWSLPDTVVKKDFYQAVKISCEAVIDFSHRNSELAEKTAAKEKDVLRKDELMKIAGICRRVPKYPARNFHEALQFMYFIHLCLLIEDNGVGISIGRFDQFLWDFYKKDLEEGIITREEALELTENFYIMIYSINKIRSWPDTDFFRGLPIFQNLTIGGQDPKTKSDSTNELSYIALEATANVRLPQPSLTVRFHAKTPFDFKIKVAEVIKLGIGLPSIFNDNVYIPALINRGYEIDDAYDYCIIGCVEPGVSGLLGGRTGGAWFNLTKVLEMALYNGIDKRTGYQLHVNKNNKDLSTFGSYEDLKEAYLDQLNYYINIEAILENTIDQCWEDYLEEPMAAAFGCPSTTIPRGKPIKKGGAKYDFTGQQTIGTANIANSLYAIKKLVFKDKIITGGQLLHALETNYKDNNTSPSGEEIRALCISAPKYGNDIDEVDEIARDMLAYFANTIVKYKNTRFGRGPIGCTLHCSTSTVSSNIPFGKVCGATPDGRDAFTAVADGQSPMRGTDLKGPTAAIASVSKINNILLSDGSLYNLKFSPKDLR